MKTISFTDDSRTELKTFINTSDCAVVSITQDDQFFLAFKFDDENEIDEFIEELKKVKEILIKI